MDETASFQSVGYKYPGSVAGNLLACVTLGPKAPFVATSREHRGKKGLGSPWVWDVRVTVCTLMFILFTRLWYILYKVCMPCEVSLENSYFVGHYCLGEMCGYIVCKVIRFYCVTLLRYVPSLKKLAQTSSSKTKGKLFPEPGIKKIKWTITRLSGHSSAGKRVWVRNLHFGKKCKRNSWRFLSPWTFCLLNLSWRWFLKRTIGKGNRRPPKDLSLHLYSWHQQHLKDKGSITGLGRDPGRQEFSQSDC